MGCKPDDNTELDGLYRECVALVKSEAAPKAVWRKSKVDFVGEDTVVFDFGKITSAALCKNLEGCKEAYVFAATAGIGVDRLMLKYKHIDAVRNMVIGAVGSSLVECWCDKINEKIADGKKTRPRFSPGYGDLPLDRRAERNTELEGAEGRALQRIAVAVRAVLVATVAAVAEIFLVIFHTTGIENLIIFISY